MIPCVAILRLSRFSPGVGSNDPMRCNLEALEVFLIIRILFPAPETRSICHRHDSAEEPNPMIPCVAILRLSRFSLNTTFRQSVGGTCGRGSCFKRHKPRLEQEDVKVRCGPRSGVANFDRNEATMTNINKAILAGLGGICLGGKSPRSPRSPPEITGSLEVIFGWKRPPVKACLCATI